MEKGEFLFVVHFVYLQGTHWNLWQHAELSGGCWESFRVPGQKTFDQHRGDTQT